MLQKEKSRNVLVSISCITYNQEPYIRQCLDGFIMQKTDFNFEVLIHDDASTDGTAAIIREYEKKYPDTIKPIYQKENQYSKGKNISATFNWPRAKGKYIAICEGDDYWIDPYKLQKQVDILEQESNRELMAVATNSSVCDKDSNLIYRERLVVPKNKTGVYNLHDFFKDKHQYPTLTVMFRNCYSQYVSESMEKLNNPFLGDWTLWIILHLKGNFYFLNEVTAAYRINPTSVTHTANRIKRWEEDFTIRKKLLDFLPKEYHKYVKNNWNTYFELALAYRKQKDKVNMVKNFLFSFLAHPLNFIKRITVK